MKEAIRSRISNTKEKEVARMGKVLWGAVVFAFLSAGYSAQATDWDVARDFSATDNPNEAWTYRWSLTLTSPLSDLNLYPDSGKLGELAGTPINIDSWCDWEQFSSYTPNVAHNGTGSTNNEHPTITWQVGQFSLHPGDNGVYSHALWTAPYAGTFDIAATFTGIDKGTNGLAPGYWGTTTDVHVLHNGVSLFDGSVDGFSDTAAFSTTLSIGMGDTIDFAVGDGGNGPTCDTTALSAIITPEPATGLMLGLGGLGLLRKRRA